jgi:hypothetical protein
MAYEGEFYDARVLAFVWDLQFRQLNIAAIDGSVPAL